MLSERDMQELSILASKLSVEGYNVSDIMAILTAERAKINSAAITDLMNYFPITNNIGLKLSKIEYGYNKLNINMAMSLERISGVFDINSKPDMFEDILRNAIYNCLKDIKQKYTDEVNELGTVPTPPSTVVTASTSDPISFTVGTNVLYTEVGTIDTALAWTVADIKDSAGASIDSSGISETATGTNPLTLEITDGTTTLTFTITSGTYDGTAIIGNNVVIAGGV